MQFTHVSEVTDCGVQFTVNAVIFSLSRHLDLPWESKQPPIHQVSGILCRGLKRPQSEADYTLHAAHKYRMSWFLPPRLLYNWTA
jgi:hypothetical protein